MSRRNDPPNYEVWLKRERWTLGEAVMLACGHDPGKHTKADLDTIRRLNAEDSQICKLHQRALEAPDGILPGWRPPDPEYEDSQIRPAWGPNGPRQPHERFVPSRRPAEPKAHPTTNWTFQPHDFLTWTEPYVELPEALKPEATSSAVGQRSTNLGRAKAHAIKREQILGAAIAVMAAHPDECRRKSEGPWVAARIADSINENSFRLWPECKVPPLTHNTMAQLISEWLRKLQR